MKLAALHESFRRIQDHYPGPYGLGYNDSKDVWDSIRNHPLFIAQVLAQIALFDKQIEEIEAYQSDHPNGIRASLGQAITDLGNMSAAAREIANDVGWNDVNDIMLAIQRHPLAMERLREREEKQRRRDNLMTV